MGLKPQRPYVMARSPVSVRDETRLELAMRVQARSPSSPRIRCLVELPQLDTGIVDQNSVEARVIPDTKVLKAREVSLPRIVRHRHGDGTVLVGADGKNSIRPVDVSHIALEGLHVPGSCAAGGAHCARHIDAVGVAAAAPSARDAGPYLVAELE